MTSRLANITYGQLIDPILAIASQETAYDFEETVTGSQKYRLYVMHGDEKITCYIKRDSTNPECDVIDFSKAAKIEDEKKRIVAEIAKSFAQDEVTYSILETAAGSGKYYLKLSTSGTFTLPTSPRTQASIALLSTHTFSIDQSTCTIQDPEFRNFVVSHSNK